MYENNNELQHYGVKGMKWGVKRATKRFNTADTDDKRRKAVATLAKHKSKATKKIAKLEKKNAKLEKKNDAYLMKTNAKVAKLERRAAITRAQAYTRFSTKEKAERNLYKANKMEATAQQLKSKYEMNKAIVESNKKIAQTMTQQIGDIDKIITGKGKKYLQQNK